MSKNPSGVGLFLHELAKKKEDKYFETVGHLAPIHGNIYIPSDERGEARIVGSIADQIDDVFIIFDRIDENNYPFEYVELVINDIRVWKMSSLCMKMLELATVGEIKHKNLPQIAIRLPLWLSRAYQKQFSSPNRINRYQQDPYFSYGNDIRCYIQSTRPYTLGIHTIMLPVESRKDLKLMNISAEVYMPVDKWEENHVVIDKTDYKKYDSDNTNQEEKTINQEEEEIMVTRVTIPNISNLVATDFLFGAVDSKGEFIPIKYLRAIHADIEVLAINTSQLQYDLNEKIIGSHVYLYSHQPG